MMTIDALSFHFLTAQHIVVDHALVVILQATLTDGQLLVRDERRVNTTIADIGIYGIRRYEDLERLEARPLIIFACIHLHLNGSALGLVSKLSPFPN